MRLTLPPAPDPTRLVVAIIQRQDLEPLLAALHSRAYRVTILASAGGFLGHSSVTLLVAVADWQVRIVRQLLGEHCHEREEWRAIAPEFPEAYLVPPLSVMVGGAIIFVLPIVRYERLLPPT
jgi:uncharacterized protein YaaQ